MRLIFGALVMFAIAACIGLGTTWLTTTYGTEFGTLKIGAWTARPKAGTTSIDPYAQAGVVRGAILPIGSGDGVAFYTDHDDNGRLLDGRCDVSLHGVTPPARYWTLTLYNPDGQLVANTLNRYGFTSQEIARDAKGEFELRIAPRARAGNWLPSGGAERYVLVLRFYDTPVGVASRTTRDTPMPTIKVQGCS